MILPHINYCILSWGKQNNDILLLQKRAMRSICHDTYKVHSEPLFKECHSLKINDIYEARLQMFYYKLMRNELPHYLNNHRRQISKPLYEYVESRVYDVETRP